jgi:hypothetical protein
LRPPAQGLSDEDLLRREGLARQRDQFGGVRVGEPPQRDQFGGIRVGYPPPPRAKPPPPPTAGEQYARGLGAGHFNEGDETPLTRTLRAGQEQMDVPDSQSHYMNRALNAWQAMGAQGAGEVAKVGANALGIETGPAEQFAGEAMSAFPGLVGAEGAPHIAPRAAEAARAAPEAAARAEPIPPRVPETPTARPAGEPIPPAMPKAPSEPQAVLLNIAKGRPADAPPEMLPGWDPTRAPGAVQAKQAAPPVEQAPVARAAGSAAGTCRSSPRFRRARARPAASARHA